MTITDMTLPDEVVEATANAIEDEFMPSAFAEDVLIDFKFPARAAIRAALQAMVDCGMAIETSVFFWEFEGTDIQDKFRGVPVLAIRLKRKEQK